MFKTLARASSRKKAWRPGAATACRLRAHSLAVTHRFWSESIPAASPRIVAVCLNTALR